jgi:hypothetical protein
MPEPTTPTTINSDWINRLDAIANEMEARGKTTPLSYHEALAYNDARMGSQNLKWADEKHAEAAVAEAKRLEEAQALVAKNAAAPTPNPAPPAVEPKAKRASTADVLGKA